MKTVDESEGGGEPKKKVYKKASQKPDALPDTEQQQIRGTSKTKRDKNP